METNYKIDDIIQYIKEDMAEKKDGCSVIDFLSSDGEYSAHWDQYDGIVQNKNKLEMAKSFMDWVNVTIEKEHITVDSILDAGCGEGYHLPYMDKNSVRFALDYSSIIYKVAEVYKNDKMLVPLRADLLDLPFKDNTISVYLAFGSINCTQNMNKAINESIRILKPDGIGFIWALGVKSMFIKKLLTLDRLIYKYAPEVFKKTYRLMHIPAYILAPNSTNMSLAKNSIREFDEIISNNLTPAHYEILDSSICWKNYLKDKPVEIISTFDAQPCGVAYRKIV